MSLASCQYRDKTCLINTFDLADRWIEMNGWIEMQTFQYQDNYSTHANKFNLTVIITE